MVQILQKSRLMIAGLLIGVLGISTVSVMSGTASAAANSCDKVNIVYCGLDGSSDAAYINAFKNAYTSNKSGHESSPTVKQNYTDLQAVYNWAGASSSVVSGMNATNTKVGTLYKDGHIVVDGKTVATGAWVSARFTNGSGFTKVEGNVYARKTTTSFANPTAKVIVYMKDGQAVFAVMTECGNAVKITPVKTPEKPTTPTTPTTPETPKTPETPNTPTTVTTVSTTPEKLPNTGAGDIFGLFSGVTMAGAGAHRILQSRRANRK